MLQQCQCRLRTPRSPASAKANRRLAAGRQASSVIANTPLAASAPRSDDFHESRARMNTMALYLIGDVQGCDGALQRLLIRWTSPQPRHPVPAGRPGQPRPGLAGRAAPLMRYGSAAQCLLGNHDLNLLAVAHGVRQPASQGHAGCHPQAPTVPPCCIGCATGHGACCNAKRAGADGACRVLPRGHSANPGAGGRSAGRSARTKPVSAFRHMYGNTRPLGRRLPGWTACA